MTTRRPIPAVLFCLALTGGCGEPPQPAPAGGAADTTAGGGVADDTALPDTGRIDTTRVDTARVDTGSEPSAAEGSSCADPRPEERPGTRVVTVYFACTGDVPGQLYPAYRAVPEDAEAVQAALEEMLAGPDEAERSLGYQSLFSDRTAGMLHGVTRSATGDTLTIDFADFRAALRDSPNPTSFVPGGVMADITWTVFQQFPDVRALRFAFDGDEGAFWSWLSARSGEPQVFTRTDWEQV